METILKLVESTDFWVLLGTVFAASGLQLVFKKKVAELGPKRNAMIAFAISALIAASQSVGTVIAHSPELFGAYTTLIFGVSTMIYRFVLQPSLSVFELYALGKQARDLQAAAAEQGL